MVREPLPLWKQRLQFWPLRAGVALLRLAGPRISLWGAALAGSIFYRLSGRHRRRALRHLRLAFPDWEPARLDAAAKRSFQNFLQLAIEMVFMLLCIHRGNYEQHIERHDPIGCLPLLRERKAKLLVTGHLGNWEATGYFLSLEGHPLAAVARPLDNRLLNDWLVSLRTRRGMKVIEKWDRADAKIVQSLENQEAVGFIADQNGGDRGVFVPFFGRLASTSKSVALLAINLRVPILCGCGVRVSRWGLRYRISSTDLIRPEDWESQEDPIYYITARFVRAIEQMVREQPDRYLWMHRRWKSRPQWEVKGQPMPASFERRLRALPWMDEATLSGLKEPLGFDSYA